MLNRDRKRRTCGQIYYKYFKYIRDLREFSLRLSQQSRRDYKQIGKERENRSRAEDWPRLKILV